MKSIHANPVGNIKNDREYRKTSNKLPQEDVLNIVETLKHTYRLNGDIARQYHVGVHLIERINKGVSYRVDNEKYPIREWKSCGKSSFTYEDITQIIYLLKYTNQSFRSIAKQYNVTFGQISAICSGKAKKYRRENETYPLRPHS